MNQSLGAYSLNKTVYVQSYFKAIGREATVQVATGEKKRSFFGGETEITRNATQWQQTGWSDCEIDGERLARELQVAIDKLNHEGYSVISVSPITSGHYDYKYQPNGTLAGSCSGGGFGYAYGYSVTEGLIVIAHRQ